MISSKYYTVHKIGSGRYFCTALFADGWMDLFGILADNETKARSVARSVMTPATPTG